MNSLSYFLFLQKITCFKPYLENAEIRPRLRLSYDGELLMT
ncbi:hypothetical protein MtrunA17_Chr6g0466401 [Medicago truncatula]|uniref:Uncharacterized protein n=1 Tax=Medicago truncatula TaxID=3880 RepID=A0A396HCX4_MEDTR|nr:hypothetical protein MtrunA17_Chr6g0465581 [Medicago truncatula]RHN51242.1 hypothetical protein MtrunA17_Chr6g0466401 [Medicago truncatula]